jgi:hypothetical protein
VCLRTCLWRNGSKYRMPASNIQLQQRLKTRLAAMRQQCPIAAVTQAWVRSGAPAPEPPRPPQTQTSAALPASEPPLEQPIAWPAECFTSSYDIDASQSQVSLPNGPVQSAAPCQPDLATCTTKGRVICNVCFVAAHYSKQMSQLLACEQDWRPCRAWRQCIR